MLTSSDIRSATAPRVPEPSVPPTIMGGVSANGRPVYKLAALAGVLKLASRFVSCFCVAGILLAVGNLSGLAKVAFSAIESLRGSGNGAATMLSAAGFSSGIFSFGEGLATLTGLVASTCDTSLISGKGSTIGL